MKLIRTLAPLASLTVSACLVGGVAMAAVPHINVGRPVAPHIRLGQPACHPSKTSPETNGLFELVGEALSDVSLLPAQKDAVQKLGTEVKPLQDAVDKARTELLAALADDIGTAKFERAALGPKIDAFVAAREAESPVLRKALVSLHKVLDAKQRAKFADSLEKRLEQAAEAFKSGSALDQIGKEIGLTEAQKKDLHARLGQIVKAGEPEQRKGREMLQAFRGDTFDPDAIVPERDLPARARAHATKMVDMAEAFSGILTPEQRAKAAAKLKARLEGC